MSTQRRNALSNQERALLESRLLARRNVAQRIPRLDRSGGATRVPASFAQRRLWFLEQLQGQLVAYNLSMSWRLRGPLNAEALRRAMEAIVRRHESLRTTFELEGDVPIQIVRPPGGFELPVYDLRTVPVDQRQAEASRLCHEEAERPFDLEADVMLRAALLRLEDEVYVLLVIMHHVATDVWSIRVFERELTFLYDAFCCGGDANLPELPLQYVDFAVWQQRELQGPRLENLVKYWGAQLEGMTPLNMPTDRPRPPMLPNRGARHPFKLKGELVDQLKMLSQTEGVTLHMMLLAAFQVLLARYSGQGDIAVGMPIAGRNHAELEDLIGFFINTLVLRTDLSGEPTFRELLARVRRVSLAAYDHQDLPFEKLVAELQPERHPSRNPLVQVLFQVLSFPDQGLSLRELEVSELPKPSERVRFDLAMHVWQSALRGEDLRGTVAYSTDLFDGATIERLVGHFVTLLQGIVADPDQRISALPLLTEAERQQLLVTWNDTAVAYPRDRCVHQLFEEQVERTPAAVAVVCEDQQLTYRELNERANQLARHLRGLGVGPDKLVGLGVDRSLEMLVGLLGILKAGGAFVPLDPEAPPARQRTMMADAKLDLVVTTAAQVGAWSGDHAPTGDGTNETILVVDRFGKPQPDEMPPSPYPLPLEEGREGRVRGARARGDNLAYVLYTSGSTGRPKGVMVEHRQLMNYVHAVVAKYGMGRGGSFAMVQPLTVDSSQTILFPALGWGGCVHLIARERSLDATTLGEYFTRHAIDYLKIAPSHLSALLTGAQPQRLLPRRVLILGGEALHWTLPERLAAIQPGCQVWNHYGPTETTVGVLTYPIDLENDPNRPRSATVPLGHPLANVSCHVVDGQGNLVPVGIPGELYIGGDLVTRGYLGNPDLTTQTFVSDRFAPAPGARLYRTGDVVRRLPDGALEFLGRRDEQVKIRGFRIELGEIEAVLSQHPAVRDCVVVLREEAVGDPFLAAYIVLHPPHPTLSPDTRGEGRVRGSIVTSQELREFSGSRLPEVMAPSAYIFLDALPRTPNGKVDRKSLPSAQHQPADRKDEFIAPRNRLEQELVQIWGELLGLERVGIHDNFFELGGHSLLAVQLLERMRRAGLHIDIRTLFLKPTVAELAAAPSAASRGVEVPPNGIPAGCAAISSQMLPLVQLTSEEIARIAGTVPGGAANIQDIYPLSPLQEGILFHHLLATQGDPYLLCASFAFDSRDRLQRYLAALQFVIDRHDILRTAIVYEGLPEPVQVVWRQATLVVEEVDFGSADGEVAQRLREHFTPETFRLDVRRAPMLRVFVCHDQANSRWVMRYLFHHLTSDHITRDLIDREIEAHTLGQADRLPPPAPFRNFIVQARLGVSTAEHQEFFRRMLGDVDEVTAPFGLTDVRGDGSVLAEARERVDGTIARRLHDCARAMGVSAASLFHVAWAQVLARLSGRNDVVFGTVLFGRTQTGSAADAVLGPFLNTLPVRIDVGEVGVADGVRQTHHVLAQLLRHEHAPLALAQRCSSVAAPMPLFSAVLNYRHSSDAAASARPATPGSNDALQVRDGIQRLGFEERTNYPVVLSVDDFGVGVSLEAQVQSGVQPSRICSYVASALAALVAALENAPGTPLRTLDVLPSAERQQLLVEWNDTAVAYPHAKCVQQLFEEQVERTPAAVAVVFEGQELTYRELNARANQLAHHLRELGVGPETLVALYLERSAELVVAVLGIWKAGGAYVPLDPAHPEERLQFMLEDSQAPVLVTTKALLPRLKAPCARVVRLDADVTKIARQADSNPEHRADPDNLAYVLYTSGSTGRPKGVAVMHRGPAALIDWALRTFTREHLAGMLFSTSICFDLSVFELLAPLSCGGKVILVRDALHLPECAAAGEVTFVNTVPSVMAELLRRPGLPVAVKVIALCGEPLSARLAQQCYQLPSVEQVFNLYGPTEASVYSTFYRVPKDLAGPPSIGRPISGTRAYVLDEHLQPVPLGVPGELYLGGAGLARGYLNRPELTREKFIANPFSADPDSRLYRTGDACRWRADGNLEFLRRLDNQVKLHGYRIELGEIEGVLREHPQVQDTAVVVHQDAAADDKTLVAYVVPHGQAPTLPDIRSFVQQKLPSYMIPAVFVFLERLPLTANGKVDRRALPPPDWQASEPEHDESVPRTPTEEVLIEIWATVLNLERVGIHDNFFELGGHSLLATRVVLRVRHAFGVELPLHALFEAPTIAGLALLIVQHLAARVEPVELAAIWAEIKRPSESAGECPLPS
jgi:amino acid adenylation domain-containing protein